MLDGVRMVLIRSAIALSRRPTRNTSKRCECNRHSPRAGQIRHHTTEVDVVVTLPLSEYFDTNAQPI